MDKFGLEIVIISAHDLKDVSMLGSRMRTFAVVWSDSTTRSSTGVDCEGGTYPAWNQKLQTCVSKHFLHQKGSNIVIQIFCKTMLGNKSLGCARVPYSDIVEGYGSPDSLHFLSYRITRPSGRRQGTIDLSLRFLEKINPGVRISSKPDMYLPGFSSSKSKTHGSSSYRQRQQNHANGQCALGIPLSSLQPLQFPQQQYMPHTLYSNFGPQSIAPYADHSRFSPTNF